MDKLEKAIQARLEYLETLNNNGALRDRKLIDEYITLKAAMKYPTINKKRKATDNQ